MVRGFTGAAVLFAVLSSPIHAGPITDTVDPANVFVSFGATPAPCPAGMTCGSGSLSFVHDITNDGFVLGDIISSASIAIRLAELVTTGVNNETFSFTVGPQTPDPCLHGNCVPNPGHLEIISLTAAALADLSLDGKIDVTIQASSGGFYFADSTLTAEVSPGIRVLTENSPTEPRSASVPVPSTLLLLGGGMMALGLRTRSNAAK